MKRLYIVVEGQTEQEFVNTLLRPWFNNYGILNVTPILIKTSKHGRGGHVNAEHLKNTINGLLHETNDRNLIGVESIMARCPRFSAWIELLVKRTKT